MKKITAYVTSDGILHDSYEKAKAHAEERYGNQLTKMARELVEIEKYSHMIDKLDSCKGSMQRILDLAADLIVESQ